MQAITFDAVQKKLQLVKVDRPKIKDAHDIIVKVAYSGICGTDLHIIQGEFPCQQKFPVTLGHEFAGIVAEVGKDVAVVKVGDKVAIDPNHGCDVCEFCHTGNPHFCKAGGINNTVGIFRHGGWAEYVLVPENQIFKLPEALTVEQGALTEPLSCLAHGWDRVSPVTLGQKILVIGAGIIGNLWIITLHLQGHKHVTVSEPNQARLELLKKSFIKYDYVTPDVIEQRKKSNPELYDLVIDCSGNYRAIEQGFSALRPGGKLCIFGVAPPHAKISISPFEIYNKELTIIGVDINPYTFPKAIGMMESFGSRYLNYDLLGIKKFKLSQYEEALEALKQGSIAKAVFEIA